MTKTTKSMVYKHSNDSESYVSDIDDTEVNSPNKTNAKSTPIKLRLPLNFGALSPGFMRRSCAEPPASVARIAWG